MKAYVVQVGTAGNQRYIFESTKRKEIVGASQLIAGVDSEWVGEALAEVFPGFTRGWRLGDQPAELLACGAGGATILVRDRDRGRELVERLTLRALSDAPGLEVRGAIREFTWDGDSAVLALAIDGAYAQARTLRSALPGPASRYLRLPVVASCPASGLPAAGRARLGDDGDDRDDRARSASCLAKLRAYPVGLSRLAGSMGLTNGTSGSNGSKVMADTIDWLGLRAEWVAVVHADGNALGALIRALATRTSGGARGYADQLRDLSEGIDSCTRAAFRRAVTETADAARPELAATWAATGRQGPAILPLVLGGDDLTVICDADIALTFTTRYLRAFAEISRDDPRLAPVLRAAGRKRIGVSAGVAVVKRQYPFAFAYDLAEELTKEAKRPTRDGRAEQCTLAFHVLYESARAELSRIRGDGRLRLTAGPYLVDAGESDAGWAHGRRWSDLERRIGALRTKADHDDGRPLIPRGPLHEVREGLVIDATAVRPPRDGGAEPDSYGIGDLRWRRLRARYPEGSPTDRALASLAGGSPVWESDGQPVTGLVDAMDAEPFLAGVSTDEGSRR